MTARTTVLKTLLEPVLTGLFVAALFSTGCKSRTETGYEPRKLGDSQTVQRGYYASPFSTEAREAQAERAQDGPDRRPNVGGNTLGPGRY